MNATAMQIQTDIHVAASPDHVFRVFADDFTLWWPKSHHIGGEDDYTAIIEPRAGGRWYERGASGAECEWGQVLAYDPPQRILLRWGLDHNWQYDPSLDTQVEVTFESENEGTRVTLRHFKLENLGANATAVRDAVGSDQGWPTLLALMKGFAESR
jgi:uncharacterized protein YndB with AHSA1/START domain